MNMRNLIVTWGFLVVLIGSIAYGSLEMSQVNEQADIDHSGNILYAVNFGTGDIHLPAITFYSPASYPNLSYARTTEGSVLDWQGAVPNLVYPSTGDSDLDRLLGGLIYKTNMPSSPDGSIYVTAPGLTVGNLYQLQIINYEPLPIYRAVNFVVEDITIASNIQTLDQQGGVVGNGGSNLTYSFTATDSILNFAIVPVNNASSATTGLSAFVLSEVPEPATLSLFAFGAVALLRRRR